jgi:DNA polymerase III alpha subunit (gram-positive type)
MYLVLDTETAGLDANKHPILSLSLGIYTTSGNIFKELDLLVKPDNEELTMQVGAFKVNKINLVEHYSRAWNYQSAKQLVVNLLNIGVPTDSSNKLTVVGHRTQFDLNFLSQIITKEELKSYVDSNHIDTAVIAKFLGIPFTNLKTLATYLNIPYNEEDLHTAKGDRELTKKVFFTMRDKVYGD